MANENNMQLDLYMNTAPAEKSMDVFTEKVVNQGETASKKVENAFSVSWASVGKAAAAAAAVVAATVVVVMKKAVDAAIESEMAVKRLNSSLALAGDYSKQASQELQLFASQMQATTGISDESVMGMLSFAKSLGATNDQAKKISETAINMSKVLGVDVQTASEQLAKSLTSGAGKLSAYDSNIKLLTDSQLKAGVAIDMLASRFAGSAQASMMGFTGGVARLSVSFDEALESIGKLVISSPLLGTIVNKLADWFLKLGEKVTELGAKGDVFKTIALNVLWFSKIINENLSPAFELAFNISKVFFNGLTFWINSAIAMYGKLGGVIADGLNALGIENSMTQKLKTFAESSQAVLDESGAELRASMESIFDFPLTATLDQKLLAYEGFIEKLKEKNGELINGSRQINTEFSEESKKTFDAVNSAANSALANGVSNAMSKMTTAVMNGTMSFKLLKNAALDIMGDMAVSIGRTMVAIGIATTILGDALMGLQGGPAIAAGLGLIAFGTVLKGMAGGSVGGAATGGGGVASSSELVATGNDAIASSESEKKEEKPTVNLTIMGNVLDSNESSLHIVDLLNSAFDKQGVTLRTT